MKETVASYSVVKRFAMTLYVEVSYTIAIMQSRSVDLWRNCVFHVNHLIISEILKVKYLNSSFSYSFKTTINCRV